MNWADWVDHVHWAHWLDYVNWTRFLFPANFFMHIADMRIVYCYRSPVKSNNIINLEKYCINHAGHLTVTGWRSNAKEWWMNLSEGQRMFWFICYANALVFVAWKIPSIRPTMLKYFATNPVSNVTCLPMVLSMFSHFNLWHLAANMYVLHSFSTAAVGYLGKEQFLAVYLSSGVMSSFVSNAYKILLNRHGFSLGASGAIMGILAFICTQFPDTKLSIIMLPQFTFSAGSKKWAPKRSEHSGGFYNRNNQEKTKTQNLIKYDPDFPFQNYLRRFLNMSTTPLTEDIANKRVTKNREKKDKLRGEKRKARCMGARAHTAARKRAHAHKFTLWRQPSQPFAASSARAGKKRMCTGAKGERPLNDENCKERRRTRRREERARSASSYIYTHTHTHTRLRAHVYIQYEAALRCNACVRHTYTCLTRSHRVTVSLYIWCRRVDETTSREYDYARVEKESSTDWCNRLARRTARTLSSANEASPSTRARTYIYELDNMHSMHARTRTTPLATYGSCIVIRMQARARSSAFLVNVVFEWPKEVYNAAQVVATTARGSRLYMSRAADRASRAIAPSALRAFSSTIPIKIRRLESVCIRLFTNSLNVHGNIDLAKNSKCSRARRKNPAAPKVDHQELEIVKGKFGILLKLYIREKRKRKCASSLTIAAEPRLYYAQPMGSMCSGSSSDSPGRSTSPSLASVRTRAQIEKNGTSFKFPTRRAGTKVGHVRRCRSVKNNFGPNRSRARLIVYLKRIARRSSHSRANGEFSFFYFLFISFSSEYGLLCSDPRVKLFLERVCAAYKALRSRGSLSRIESSRRETLRAPIQHHIDWRKEAAAREGETKLAAARSVLRIVQSLLYYTRRYELYTRGQSEARDR
ncbi:unnamed protein product [Trichogramma brassicae]|uniref:rhomboid protease n=1 Tax=Trichogramma brassicae TaxID=86971 RepID=A0A6H5IE07_9HYME|nr:unnamed protein product [Trichogramma brassicae]